DPIFLEYPQHLKNFNPSRELNKEIQPENKSIKQVVTEKKQSEITKNEDLINSRPKDPTNISIQAKEHKHETTDIYGHSPHHKEYLERENKNGKRNLVKGIIQISFKRRRRAKPYDRIAPNQKLSSNSPLHLAHGYKASIQNEKILQHKKEESNYFSTQIGQNTEEIGIHKEITYSINTKESMENKSEPNIIYRSNSINHSINSKEEDSPTPHYHSDKYNPNLNLEANYFSLDKAKESQINKNEEINEDISNRQEKQDQKALSKPTNMEEIESDGILLTEDQFPWEGYTNWQPLRNEKCNLELYKITEQDHQCSVQHVKWVEGIKKAPNEETDIKKEKLTKEEREYFWITQNKKLWPNLQAHLARQYQNSIQNEDWKENKNENGSTNHEYLRDEKELQGQYLNKERRNELTAKKAKFKNGLDSTFLHPQ
ncbi:hypothetical protein O181_128531, partial [Austropuccinia psidii MF-1]|nr:hypothetical protein [Austropuccinia psidii MF-1]